MGQRHKHPVAPWRYVNFTNVIFRPIKRLKLFGNWFPERSVNLYLVLSREKRIMGHYVVLVCRQYNLL